ncbi:MAG: hypothetical protein M3362_25030 [Acidobacteriota bacterium]|nr:hypothetical protein [Acidobacteriota bacterium]
MIKAKFGERLRSKTERAQINKCLLKVLCHNICVVIQSIYELGLEVEIFEGESIMLAYLHGEGICLPPIIFFLLGIPVAILIGKLLTKNNDK